MFKTAQQKFKMFKSVYHVYHLNSSFTAFLGPWYDAIITRHDLNVKKPVV